MSEIERIKTQVELIDNGMMHTHFSVKSIKILLAALAESERKRLEAVQKVCDLEEDARRFPTLAEFSNLQDERAALTTERDELRGRLKAYEEYITLLNERNK